MSSPWRIIFMGTPQVAAATLEQLMLGPDPVVGVVTQPDAMAGRGLQTAPSPVRKLAESRGLAVVAPVKIRTPEFVETLRAWQPDIMVVVAYGRILPKTILELAPHGCINVHYSLLPKYRGAAPAAWTIANGEKQGGVSTMQLVEQMDAGAIYLQEAVELAPDETTRSLQAKLTPVGGRLLLETLAELKTGALTARPQDESQATFAPILKKADGRIDWQRPAGEIERRIRAFDPWPGSYTTVGRKLLKVHRVKLVDTARQGRPGEIIRCDSGGFWVAASDGALSLEEVQQENKRRLPGSEFIKGARINPGELLE